MNWNQGECLERNRGTEGEGNYSITRGVGAVIEHRKWIKGVRKIKEGGE